CACWLIYAEILRPRRVISDRLHRAKTIALACKLYAADHGGRFPDRVEDLLPAYIPDRKWLTFPSADGKRQLSYEYFGGHDTDPPDAVLIRVAPERPGGSSIVVRADQSGAIEKDSTA